MPPAFKHILLVYQEFSRTCQAYAIRYIMNNFGSYPTISMVSSLSTTKNLGATGNSAMNRIKG